jgi:hypothetical protein
LGRRKITEPVAIASSAATVWIRPVRSWIMIF